MSEHKYIWLQPECCADPDEGRHWCQDPDPVDCDDGKPWVKYVLASEAEQQLLAVRGELERTTIERNTACDHADRLLREAKIHAQEARTANATIGEIYQVLTGATGEPGNWNGAEPARKVIEQLTTLKASLQQAQGERDDLRVIARRLVAWDKKWGKGTIFPYGRMEECHGELDSCVDAFKDLVKPTPSDKQEAGGGA